MPKNDITFSDKLLSSSIDTSIALHSSQLKFDNEQYHFREVGIQEKRVYCGLIPRNIALEKLVITYIEGDSFHALPIEKVQKHLAREDLWWVFFRVIGGNPVVQGDPTIHQVAMEKFEYQFNSLKSDEEVTYPIHAFSYDDALEKTELKWMRR
jgi:hypothetical protein